MVAAAAVVVCKDRPYGKIQPRTISVFRRVGVVVVIVVIVVFVIVVVVGGEEKLTENRTREN